MKILLDDQHVVVALRRIDDAGNDAGPIDPASNALWGMNDPESTVKMTPAADNLSADFAAIGPLTKTVDATVTCVVTTPGGAPESLSETIHVAASAGVASGMVFGDPAHK